MQVDSVVEEVERWKPTNDLVILFGGVRPLHSDISIAGMAKAFGVRLIETIRNFFAALFLTSIRMLIHVHFLWNHINKLLAAVILVIVIKTIVVTSVVKGFGYTTKTSLLVGMSLAQIREFTFVLLSHDSNLYLVEVGV